MYKKASSELVVARRRRGAHDRAEDMSVAAADRVQGPLGEDDGDDAIFDLAFVVGVLFIKPEVVDARALLHTLRVVQSVYHGASVNKNPHPLNLESDA